jgi:L-aminopeptidase/D-esterase-like protein
MAHATKSGLGSAALRVDRSFVVGALVAVNAGGSAVDPSTRRIIAGVRRADGAGFLDAEQLVLDGRGVRTLAGGNTTLGVVATNAPLDKAMANRLAQVAHDGLARALRPVHTQFDGDAVFAASSAPHGSESLDFNRLAVAAVLVVEQAIVSAVRSATALGGVPAASELGPFEPGGPPGG